MTQAAEKTITTADRKVIRDLAQRVAEIAALPVMAERRKQWRRHNALGIGQPMILVFPEGSWRELLPESALACTSKQARSVEWQLRSRIYTHEHFDTDYPIEADWRVNKAIRHSGWGLEAKWQVSDSATGAKTFDPVILHPADLKKIRIPTVTHDEEETRRQEAFYRELLGDILAVKVTGIDHVSFHLMNLYTSWRGLQEVMSDMVEDPGWVHEAMGLLLEGHKGLLRQYREQNLFSLNNGGTYHSSGGVGYINTLPAAGFDAAHVRPCDLWASAETQEFALVSPAMHREFALRYEAELLQPFGLNGYGCCEDLTLKMADVLKLPQIRRISVSPFADVQACAEQIGAKAIFSWKPHPAHLVGEFKAGMVRQYLQDALAATRGCVLEIILKDTHTCAHHPDRFDAWTKIARACVKAR